MECTQISRDMARTLRLNEDLAECIALAHDLGHPPFGHAGEEAMRGEMGRHGGTFEHNEQSLRVVTLLEERSKKYAGLNLNREVLEGLMKHQTAFDEPPASARRSSFDKLRMTRATCLEAQIVNIADEIAYTAHDVDDGLRAEMIRFDDILKISLFAEAAELAQRNRTEVRGALIHLLVSDVYAETERRLNAHTITTLNDVHGASVQLVAFSENMHSRLGELRAFLWAHLYNAPAVIAHSGKGKEIIRALFRAYEENPPEKVLELREKTGSTLPEAVKDYIAGMTDQYASDRAALTVESAV
jgi:dGTPase